MNIPNENSNLFDVTIEFGNDKKLKVTKTFASNNLKTSTKLTGHETNDEIKQKLNKESNYEKGLKLYYDYFQKNISKLKEKEKGQENTFTVYTPEKIKKKLKEVITDVSNLINLEYDYIFKLLKIYNFNSDKLIEEWFNNIHKVKAKAKEKANLLDLDILNLEQPQQNDKASFPQESIQIKNNLTDNNDSSQNISNKLTDKFICPILLTEHYVEDTYALNCGHKFSKDCWKQYLKTSLLNDFEDTILNKKCIHAKCNEYVKKKNWKYLCDKPLYQKYKQTLLHIYIKHSPNLKKCPNEQCQNVIELNISFDNFQTKNGQDIHNDFINNYTNQKMDGTSSDLTTHNQPFIQKKSNRLCNNTYNYAMCICGNTFCFKCLKEYHRPVSCFLKKEWETLLTKEDNNIKWININTKKCPNCDNPIEKNSGCMNIKCICGYSFCWLCLEKWDNHRGGSYQCNKFIEHKLTQNNKEQMKLMDEKKKNHITLNKYKHFKTRFDAHHYSERFSIQTQLYFLHQFCETNNINIQKMKTLENAIIQLIDCRRILKWSYVLAYFADWNDKRNNKNLFEYYQGELEKNLDLLQTKIEAINLVEFINSRCTKHVQEVNQLTGVVSSFFTNICDCIECEISV
uniref:RBR-type E3 ubiquitin transferase n=1 Tax=Piliocolobus tephrosceles TaxID=591936 RepID=A0A8C9GME7_9PRIM